MAPRYNSIAPPGVPVPTSVPFCAALTALTAPSTEKPLTTSATAVEDPPLFVVGAGVGVLEVGAGVGLVGAVGGEVPVLPVEGAAVTGATGAPDGLVVC
ncbi:hypothetical protein D3C72_2301540 [compost metagenome]